MSPINHFYVFVVNQKEEKEEEEVKKVSKQFEIEKKSSLRYQHTQQCDDLSVKCILNRVLWLLVLLL